MTAAVWGAYLRGESAAATLPVSTSSISRRIAMSASAVRVGERGKETVS
jgi:hypothetical protein